MELADGSCIGRYMASISVSGYFSCGMGSTKRSLKDPLHFSSAVLEHIFWVLFSFLL